MKKGLKTQLREGNFVTENKVGFRNFVKSESQEIWWIVGSAFTVALAGGGDEEMDDFKDVVKKPQFSDKLLYEH